MTERSDQIRYLKSSENGAWNCVAERMSVCTLIKVLDPPATQNNAEPAARAATGVSSDALLPSADALRVFVSQLRFMLR